jgi:arsenate reductase (glutaredoxin)
LRHLAQHARADPRRRHRADRHRISQADPEPGKAARVKRSDGITPRGLLRRKEPMYHELGLDDPVWTDDQLLDAMLQHPKLIERPIVVTPHGTKICRPATLVHELLSPGVS